MHHAWGNSGVDAGLVAVALALCGCATGTDDRHAAGGIDRLVERITLCAYLGGEVGSGDAQRERQIDAMAAELDCDRRRIATAITDARHVHAHSAAVLDRIDAALSEAKDDYGVEY